MTKKCFSFSIHKPFPGLKRNTQKNKKKIQKVFDSISDKLDSKGCFWSNYSNGRRIDKMLASIYFNCIIQHNL